MANKKAENEAPETPEVVDENAKTAESESASELESTSEVDSTEAFEGTTEESEKTQINADVLQNIPVTISVEVGRTKLKIRDLMRLTQGSVVELDRLAGEPLDLLVNNTLVAQGEVVLVNERYGVRLTSVVPTADRVKNL
jgi:flagellar motor switch protein FliN/FliY